MIKPLIIKSLKLLAGLKKVSGKQQIPGFYVSLDKFPLRKSVFATFFEVDFAKVVDIIAIYVRGSSKVLKCGSSKVGENS